MRPIVIFFQSSSPESYPFTVERYRSSYFLLAQLAQFKDVDLRFVFGLQNYSGNMIFRKYWKIIDNNFMVKERSFRARLIYNKSSHLFRNGERVMHPPFLEELCRNKLVTHHYFHQLMKPCYPLHESNQALLAEMLQTKLVVLKPVSGASGEGIRFVNREELASFNVSQLSEPYLVQEFIDSSNGIQGLTDGAHDLRLFVFNGTVKLSYIRKPKQGSYLANIAQGGSVEVVPVEKLPLATKRIVRSIDASFKHIRPRLYTIDIMFENGTTPYVVELNSQPGLPAIELGDFTFKYMSHLLRLFSRKRRIFYHLVA
ncbi:MAG: ATP-grasp domain-containing protein [Patescibacteria group bacterium]